MTPNLFLPITVVGYVVGVVLAVLRTVYRSPEARRLASIVFALTWLVHLAAVAREGVLLHRFPLSSMGEYLLVLGWILLSLHLYLWLRLGMDGSGLVLAPLAGVVAFAALSLLSARPAHVTAPSDPWFLVHTTVSTLGMAILGLAFAMSVLYLVQDRALKSKQKLRLLERLPSLQRADQIGHRALIVGFVLLTLGIATGIAVNAALRGAWIELGPKQVFPLLAWLVFAAVLATRVLLGFHGRRSAYLTITGFALGLLTVIGMTL